MPKKTVHSLPQKKAQNIKKSSKNKQSNLEIIASAVTEWMGSISSLIVHTILFSGAFLLVLFWVEMDKMLAILTNIVSLEAIYLAIFIQMAVNKNTKSLKEVEKDIDEIQEDVDEIQEDIEEIQEDVEEIEKDVDSIEKDVDELQEDVEEINENVEDDIIEETEDEKREHERDARIHRVVDSLDLIQKQLNTLFEEMKKEKDKKSD